MTFVQQTWYMYQMSIVFCSVAYKHTISCHCTLYYAERHVKAMNVPVVVGIVAHSSLGRCFTSMFPKWRIAARIWSKHDLSSSLNPRVDMASYRHASDARNQNDIHNCTCMCFECTDYLGHADNKTF